MGGERERDKPRLRSWQKGRPRWEEREREVLKRAYIRLVGGEANQEIGMKGNEERLSHENVMKAGEKSKGNKSGGKGKLKEERKNGSEKDEKYLRN